MRLLALLVLLTAACAAERPNVLVLIGDDWRHDTLSAAGHPVVETPHLDKLAGQGTRFTRAYVTTAICGVSRASIFTGQWMSRHRCFGFTAFETPWEETYPGLLRHHGYWTGHVGKWHNGTFPADRFDFGRAYSGTHWIDQPDGSRIHVTRKNKNDALEFLRTRPKDRPFLLTLAFFAPHAEDRNPEQYLPQPESLPLYAGDTVPLAPSATDEAFRKLPPFLANPKNEGRHRWTWRFDTPEKTQRMLKNYFRLVSEVDATCGRVIAELEAQGVLDDTLILFTGDNGYFHAEHGLADKWYPYEESIRVPLIVRDPRLPSAGRTDDHLVLNVDLAPTILAAAGIPAPATMQGRDLAPLHLESSAPTDWRTEFFYEHPTIKDTSFIPSSQALVRPAEKYLFWPDFDHEQLFDLAADPYELDDLAADPSRSSKLIELRQRFATLRAAAK